MSKPSLDLKINEPLYNYVVKHLRLLREAYWSIDIDELNRRGIALLDFYEEHAGAPFEDLPLRVTDYLKENNVNLKLTAYFATLLADLYQQKHGEKPPRKSHNTNYAYTEADRPLFNQALNKLRSYIG